MFIYLYVYLKIALIYFIEYSRSELKRKEKKNLKTTCDKIILSHPSLPKNDFQGTTARSNRGRVFTVFFHWFWGDFLGLFPTFCSSSICAKLPFSLDYGYIRKDSSSPRRSRPLHSHSISIYRIICAFDVHRGTSRKIILGPDCELQRHAEERVHSCVHQCCGILCLWNGDDLGFQKKEVWLCCGSACYSLHCDDPLPASALFRIYDCKCETLMVKLSLCFVYYKHLYSLKMFWKLSSCDT